MAETEPRLLTAQELETVRQRWDGHERRDVFALLAHIAAQAALLTRFARLEEEARDAVAVARDGCGRYNPNIDCRAYLDRGRVCPECPAPAVYNLAAVLGEVRQP